MAKFTVPLQTLDRHTSSVIEKRRTLLEKESLTEHETKELRKLNGSLERLGYGYTHPDEDYRQFLIARKRAVDAMDSKGIDDTQYRLNIIENILKTKGLV